MSSSIPMVSIGFPVFNGEQTVRAALDSILSQTFKDFELLISDNASTDTTGLICLEYTKADSRIRYIRQPTNIGVLENFKFVLKEAVGTYFMWAACDDTRSMDFLEVNYRFLSENANYVASTSPNGFENWSQQQMLVRFAIEGDQFTRYIDFFKHSFFSHGFFYSLIRAKTLRDCEYLDIIFPGYDWLGFDWIIIIYLAGQGNLGRVEAGNTIFGVRGMSGHPDVYKKFNTSFIEWLLPFYRFSKLLLLLTRSLSFAQRRKLFMKLLALNVYANFEPIRWRLFSRGYGVYRVCIKPLRKKWQRN